MNRFSVLAVLVAGSLPLTVGCATKKYVRNQTTPIINNVNELDDQTAKNTHDIRDVDSPRAAGHRAGELQGRRCRSEGDGRRTEPPIRPTRMRPRLPTA